jgi:CBS domain-containing protein
MNAHNVGALVVMEGDTLEGIFTERDVLTRVVAQDRDPDLTPLAEVMTTSLVTLGPDDWALDALRLMSEIGFRHIPVVEHGRVFGMISLRDFVGAELQQFQQEPSADRSGES